MVDTITFKLNHKRVELKVDGERRLLWVLRSDLGLTGTKYGCGEGFCGACTVLINQRAAQHFGWENPLGERIQKFDTVGGKPKVY